jgi:hypothetical protein
MPRSTPSSDIGKLHRSTAANRSAVKRNFLKDRKPRRLSRFLQKLHIAQRSPKSGAKPIDRTGNTRAVSSSYISQVCISITTSLSISLLTLSLQPSSVSSHSLSSGSSSSGNSFQHAIGVDLNSNSSLGYSQSGSEYSLTKVRISDAFSNHQRLIVIYSVGHACVRFEYASASCSRLQAAYQEHPYHRYLNHAQRTQLYF